MQLKELAHSLVTTGSLIQAIDYYAANKTISAPLIQCPINYEVEIRPTILKLLLDKPKSSTTHLAVFSLLADLDKNGRSQEDVILYLKDNGIPFSAITSAIKYARLTGITRQLRSSPAIGRYYANKYKQAK